LARGRGFSFFGSLSFSSVLFWSLFIGKSSFWGTKEFVSFSCIIFCSSFFNSFCNISSGVIDFISLGVSFGSFSILFSSFFSESFLFSSFGISGVLSTLLFDWFSSFLLDSLTFSSFGVSKLLFSFSILVSFSISALFSSLFFSSFFVSSCFFDSSLFTFSSFFYYYYPYLQFSKFLFLDLW
jgi:hypothetical protein